MAWFRIALILLAVAASGDDHKPLGEIDFFGYKGFDVAGIRSALPFHEGEQFPPVRLPKAAIALSDAAGKATEKAIMSGHAGQDSSQGYALTDDPAARAAELKIRDYALQNEALILQVLAASKDAQHRAIAAEMVGYGRQSNEQIDALADACLDSDGNVRNNAVRALWVLGPAKPELAKRIPLDPLIRLVRSGEWSDLNKASLALAALTKTRDAAALEQIRSQALDSLIEMARWRSPGHAGAALIVLGRIASIDEDNLEKMVEAGQVSEILSKFAHYPTAVPR